MIGKHLPTESPWQCPVGAARPCGNICWAFSMVSMFSCSLWGTTVAPAVTSAGLWMHSTSGVRCLISGFTRLMSTLYSGNSCCCCCCCCFFWTSSGAAEEQSSGSSSSTSSTAGAMSRASGWFRLVSAIRVSEDSEKELLMDSSSLGVILELVQGQGLLLLQTLVGSQNESEGMLWLAGALLFGRSCWMRGRASARFFSTSSCNAQIDSISFLLFAHFPHPDANIN